MTLTPDEIVNILAQNEKARSLVDALHSERLSYGEYLILRNAIDEVEPLTAELAEKDKEIADLKQSAQNWHEGYE